MMEQNKKWVGIEIGGTKLQVVTGNGAGAIERRFRVVVDAAAGAAGIQVQIEKCLNKIGTQTIAAVGVGFGGPVDWKGGRIQTSHQVGGWAGFDVKAWLQGLAGAPVAVDNDANVAALAEAMHGSGSGYNPVFYMTVGSGIGGGLVTNGTIYHGAAPGEGEIGHLRLDKSGRTLEESCSGWAVNARLRTYIDAHPQSLLANLERHHTGPEAAMLPAVLESGDAAAHGIITEVADDLAFALSHAVHLFHPQTIIIGGGLSLLGEWLRRPVSEGLPHYIMKAFLPPPLVMIASLGEDVVPIGALELAKQAYDFYR